MKMNFKKTAATAALALLCGSPIALGQGIPPVYDKPVLPLLGQIPSFPGSVKQAYEQLAKLPAQAHARIELRNSGQEFAWQVALL